MEKINGSFLVFGHNVKKDLKVSVSIDFTTIENYHKYDIDDDDTAWTLMISTRINKSTLTALTDKFTAISNDYEEIINLVRSRIAKSKTVDQMDYINKNDVDEILNKLRKSRKNELIFEKISEGYEAVTIH